MRTNQLMTVRLGNYGTIKITHKDKMGSAEMILDIGNQIRESKGLKPKKLDTFLRLQDTWEKIIKLYNVSVEEKTKSVACFHEKLLDKKDSKSVTPKGEKLLYTTLGDLPLDKGGKISYSEILKTTTQFNHIIKRQTRGALVNRGTKMELVLLLELATWLDVDLWYEVYSTFVKGKLLEIRDAGGEAFKELNILIDTLPDRISKDNKQCYIDIAISVRKKLSIIDSRGYNNQEHNLTIQDTRKEIIDTACNLIRMKWIKSFNQLETFVMGYPI